MINKNQEKWLIKIKKNDQWKSRKMINKNQEKWSIAVF